MAKGGQVDETLLKPEEPSVDSDFQTDKAWVLSVQRNLYQWSQRHILTSPGLLESRMHSERCLSGSARGRAKPLVARPEWRAGPTQPYIPIKRGFLYLVAIIDWQSRKVLSWRLSNTMDTHFCVEALEEALVLHGVQEIFNNGSRIAIYVM